MAGPSPGAERRRITSSREVPGSDATCRSGLRFVAFCANIVPPPEGDISAICLTIRIVLCSRGGAMSYKVDLSDIERDGAQSITQQLVDRFTRAIDEGLLQPGEKLPTTRAVAAEAGVNHLTAARVYRRLAELGYVTATVGRGTFVRTITPAAARADDEETDEWQAYALPEHEFSYAEQVVAEAFTMPDGPGMNSLST